MYAIRSYYEIASVLALILIIRPKYSRPKAVPSATIKVTVAERGVTPEFTVEDASGGNRITSYNVCYTKLLRNLAAGSTLLFDGGNLTLTAPSGLYEFKGAGGTAPDLGAARNNFV